jgi:ketosteroid isomerase-like protein
LTDTGKRLTELRDREAIRDCMYRYCRGIDRADEAALRSAYWPDATDRHGRYSGPVEGFFEMVKQGYGTGGRNVHQVSNVLIEFASETVAAVESYFNALQRSPRKDGTISQVLIAGRYCDLFEKRGGEWRIAKRTVVYDWLEEQTAPEGSEEIRFGPRKPIGGSFPDDPVYELLRGSNEVR